MTTKRIRKKKAKRMAPGKQAQTRRQVPKDRDGEASRIDEELPIPGWVTPGAAEGDRDTVEKDLASRDELND